MRPRCAVPAGEPPGELAVDCACNCAAKKLPAARSRRKSAGATRPVCCASQHNAGCTHRCAQLAGQQNAAQTTDRANERHHGFFKVPRMISCMVLSSQLGRSKRKNWTRSGLKKGPTLLEAPQGGALTISSPSGELGAPKRMCTAGFAQLASQPCRAEGRHNVLMNMTRSGDP